MRNCSCMWSASCEDDPDVCSLKSKFKFSGKELDPITPKFLSLQLNPGLTSLQRKSIDRVVFDDVMERTQPLQSDLQRHQRIMNGGMG